MNKRASIAFEDFLAPVIAGLLLASCALPLGEESALSEQQALTVACGTYVGTGEALATDIRLGLIGKEAREKIRVANQIVGPICGNSEMVLDAGAALALVEAQLQAMVEAQLAAKGDDDEGE